MHEDSAPSGEGRHHHHLFGNHREEGGAPLEEAAEHAGFDLGADIARPLPERGGEDFDIERDIGIDNEPR